VTIATDATEEEAASAALALPEVQKYLAEGKPSRIIYVPGRILNLMP
jgi:leucyl-tRNA synthetase